MNSSTWRGVVRNQRAEEDSNPPIKKISQGPKKDITNGSPTERIDLGSYWSSLRHFSSSVSSRPSPFDWMNKDDGDSDKTHTHTQVQSHFLQPEGINIKFITLERKSKVSEEVIFKGLEKTIKGKVRVLSRICEDERSLDRFVRILPILWGTWVQKILSTRGLGETGSKISDGKFRRDYSKYCVLLKMEPSRVEGSRTRYVKTTRVGLYVPTPPPGILG